MAKVKLRASAEEVEKAGDLGDFTQPKPGLYTAKLKECNPGYSKGDDGKPDKSRPYLECVYTITGIGREGVEPEERLAQLWDYVSFSVGWKIGQFGLAMGLPLKKGAIDGEIEVEEGKPGSVIGRDVLLRVKADKNLDGDYRGKVAWVGPMSAAALPDDGSDNGSGSDPFAEGGEEDSGDELLTEEQLQEMDLKELGGLCTEFDLTPQDYIVKVRGKTDNDKTKEAVIAAILEAQGADEGAAEDDPDADPF